MSYFQIVSLGLPQAAEGEGKPGRTSGLRLSSRPQATPLLLPFPFLACEFARDARYRRSERAER